MNKSQVNILGWVGVVLILLAYAGITLDFLANNNYIYLLLNLVGSAFIAFEAYKKKDNQPVLLNIIWCFIALIGLIKILNK